MKNRFSLLLLLSLSLGLFSCDDEPTAAERAGAPKQAYDLVGHLMEEINVLSNQPVAVKKTVSEEGQVKESKTFKNLKWAEELASFSEADLNRPALIGLFNEEQGTNAAGQPIRRYVAKEDADTSVKEAVYTFDAQGHLLQVDAIIRQENMLFKTMKDLQLQFQPNANPRLQRYRLDETQELRFMEAERYGVEGEVLR